MRNMNNFLEKLINKKVRRERLQLFIPLFMSDESLQKWIASRNISGEGTKESPYIVKDIHDFPTSALISEFKTFVIFKNCDFENVFIEESKNIVLEDLKLKRLTISRSKNVVVNSCDIGTLELSTSNNNIFLRCKIMVITNKNAYSNKFEDCIIPEPEKVKLLMNYNVIPHILKLTPLMFISVIIAIIYFLLNTPTIFKIILLSIFLISLGFIDLYFFYIFIKFHKTKKNPNKILEKTS